MRRAIQKNYITIIVFSIFVGMIFFVSKKYCDIIYINYDSGCALDSFIIIKQRNCFPVIAMFVGIMAIIQEKRRHMNSYIVNYGNTNRLIRYQLTDALYNSIVTVCGTLMMISTIMYYYFGEIYNWNEQSTFIRAFLEESEVKKINIGFIIIMNVLSMVLLLVITQVIASLIFNCLSKQFIAMIILVGICSIDFVGLNGMYTYGSIRIKQWYNLTNCLMNCAIKLLICVGLLYIESIVLKHRDFISTDNKIN